jgi:hypothetical protein
MQIDKKDENSLLGTDFPMASKNIGLVMGKNKVF